MNRRYLILVIGLCAALWGGSRAQAPAPAEAPAPAPPAGPAPHLVFDSVQINLGEVVHGQDAVATFAYRNTGDAPLHILSAKPG